MFGKGDNDEAVAEGRNHQRVTHKGLISRTALFRKRPVVKDGLLSLAEWRSVLKKTFAEKKHEKKITRRPAQSGQNCFEFLRQRRMALLVAQQLLVGATCVTASSVYNSVSVQLQYVYDLLRW